MFFSAVHNIADGSCFIHSHAVSNGLALCVFNLTLFSSSAAASSSSFFCCGVAGEFVAVDC
jgi:hypothetical protein